MAGKTMKVRLRRTKLCPCPAANRTGEQLWQKLRGKMLTVLTRKPKDGHPSRQCKAKKYFCLADEGVAQLRVALAKKNGQDESYIKHYWICDHVVLKGASDAQ